MGQYDGFLQGLQVGGSLGNTILDAVAAKDRLKLGEKELAQRGDLATQDQAIRAMHYKSMQENAAREDEFRRLKAIEDADRYKRDLAIRLAGLSAPQLDQFNANIGVFGGGQPQQPQMPPPTSNARIKVTGKGISYDGTVSDAVLDSQHPVLGPIIQTSVNNTMASQAPQQPQAPGQVPISPLAMTAYNADLQAKQQAAELERRKAEEATANAERERQRQEADIRLRLAALNPQESENYNVTSQANPTNNPLLPGQVPVLRSKSNGVLPTGSAQLTDTVAGKLSNALQVKDSLDRIMQSYETLEKQGKTGPIAGRFFGMGREFQPEMQQLQAQIIAMIPSLARGVFGEVGVLTDKDAERYQKVMPNELATPETARRLFEDLRRKVDGTIASQLETYGRAGYDVSEFEPIYSAIKGGGAGGQQNFEQVAGSVPVGAISRQGGKTYVKTADGWQEQQ